MSDTASEAGRGGTPPPEADGAGRAAAAPG